MPVPRLEAIETSLDESKAKEPPRPRTHRDRQKNSFLHVVNFSASLSEAEISERRWIQALEKWYIVFGCGHEAWPQGFDLDEAISSHQLEKLRDVFGNRSANTVYKRGCDMVRFIKCFRQHRFSYSPFPLNALDIEEYVENLRDSGSKPSALHSFAEAVAFAQHVVGITFQDPHLPLLTIKTKRITERSDLDRADKKQARVLTVSEVMGLEDMLSDTSLSIEDRMAIGCMLFCLYSRSRWGDVRRVQHFVKDISDIDGRICGYIEFKTRSHKTARLVARQGIPMPLVAPVWGLRAPPWGVKFLDVAKQARRDLASLNQEPLMLAPRLDGGWMERAVTTEEASDWLMMLLRKESQTVEPTTIHTLKATPLSWCAKHGLEPNHRLILGHHVTGKQSLECYSRDALAAPLREFERVLFETRTGAFAPDQNRSGMIQTAKKTDPADLYRSEQQDQPDQNLGEGNEHLDQVEDSSSSSSSSTEDISEEEAELKPDDPVAQPAKWDPDYEMFQHKRSSVVHVKAKGGSQDTFSCGTTLTDQYEQIEVLDSYSLESARDASWQSQFGM